jgi:P-type Ca2+ transporter type 2C
MWCRTSRYSRLPSAESMHTYRIRGVIIAILNAWDQHTIGVPDRDGYAFPEILKFVAYRFSEFRITPGSPCMCSLFIMASKKKPVDQAILAPHTKSVDSVLKHFKTSLKSGLSQAQVEESRSKYGENKLDEEEGKSIFAMIMEQFEDLLVRILLGAAVVSFLLTYFDDSDDHEGWLAYVEPFVILLILFANAVVGVWQESSAEQSLEALKKLQADHAVVIRGGAHVEIDASELVPGDIVEVRVGNKIPADLRLVQLNTTSLRVEQSQLTGESESVSKELDPLHSSQKDCEIQAKKNMLFSSTTISNGACLGVVTGTGMNTEIGKIQSAVNKAAEEEEHSPLSKKIDEFGELLAKVIFAICVIVWVINYKHFFDPVHGSALKGCIYYFKIAVALAVAAIPEGLPAVITTCLALGSNRMAKKNAIVRKLPSVETLGCTTVICSDKTGTLTTNEMVCVKLALPTSTNGSMTVYEVEGSSYAPVGQVSGLKPISKKDIALQNFAKCGSICNASKLVVDATEKSTKSRFKRIGEPTEAALRVLVEKLGCPESSVNTKFLNKPKRDSAHAMAFSNYWAENIEVRATLEFIRDRKSMSVLVSENGDANKLYVKGAPESILERCTGIMMPDGKIENMTAAKKKRVMDEFVHPMATGALRTLALAMRMDCGPVLGSYDGPGHKEGAKFLSDPANFVKAEQDLVFLGLVGIQDPPRPECKPAIRACHEAGIAVIMITGDNKATADAIAIELGIIQPGDEHPSKRRSFTGKEFENLSAEQQVDILRGVSGAVFARTEPKHKQMIIRVLRSLGEITAMTGDGVNDAPALKQADIGIAMGISGTEVAKHASDMILTDDNFSTIVSAVQEGRSIYNNMKAFIRYLISSNIGEVASIFFTAALGIPEGLAPVQLLWVNLVTDGLPATALSFNPPDIDVMTKPPRNQDESLISGWVFFRYMVIGVYVGFATVGVFIYWYVFDTTAPDGHSLVTISQLMNWGKCATWDGFFVAPYTGMDTGDMCSYFTGGKVKASSLSLTVLVVIEMLNALNALSEDGSLLQIPPWSNPYLIIAMMGSVLVHFVVLYTPFIAQVFAVCPLDWHDWQLVLAFSVPVLFVDEILKFAGRTMNRREIVKKGNLIK